MLRARKTVPAAILAALALSGMGAAPAAAAGVLLPHPGPDGLVWVEESTGDGGVVSGGASEQLPTIVTVACEGGGSVRVTMQSRDAEVAAFTVDCPSDGIGVNSATMAPGIVRPGSFTVGVDASAQTIRWALTVTQPE